MSEREFRHLKSDVKRHQQVTRQRFTLAFVVMAVMMILSAFKSTSLRTDYGFVNGSHLITADGRIIDGFDAFAKRNSEAGFDGRRVTVEFNTQGTPITSDDVAIRLTSDGELWVTNENLK